jgi:NDP-sugar pyrophosphorylase family protein
MTKGIILSGGWGTRLRPLTCTIPKTLMPVGNKPVIEHQMTLLKKAGVSEIVLAVSVMSDFLKNYFKEGQRLGIKIHYTDEENPMGTAGAIKLAEDYLKDENFFMLNGDVILNFDFKDMLNSHAKYGGFGTIASILVENPARYGVLIIDQKSQRILNFQEKEEYQPLEGKIKPMPINAGVYLLEPEVLAYIPKNKKFSIEKEVFPKIAHEENLYHYAISGIWKDIGQPYELLEGNILLMNDILKNLTDKKNIIDDSVKLEGKVNLFPPCTIGKYVVIRNNCRIGPNAIIGDNVYIDENTEIRDSLIYKESYISKNCQLESTIISDNCHIHDNVILKGNGQNLVILAAYVEVMKDVQLNAKSAMLGVCHHEVIKESIK